MNAWLEIGISNGVAATLLALLALAATRVLRRPQVAFALWLLVLAKLLVPGVVGLPLASLRPYLDFDALGETRHTTQPDDEWLVAIPPLPPDEALRGDRAPADDFDATAADDDWTVDDVVTTDEASAPLPIEVDELVLEAQALEELLQHHSLEPNGSAAKLPLVDPRPLDVWHDDDSRAHWLAWLPGAIAWTWLAGAALWYALAVVRMIRFARLLRHAEPASALLQDEVRRLSARIGLARPPQVRLARRRVPPLVWAMSGRATILLPAELLDSLSNRQRATLLAHELAHLARRDYLVRWIELAAVGLYWWHPVAWWARRNVEVAAEQCCDARVVAMMPESARAYAETLLLTIEFLAEPPRPLPLGASGFSRVGHIHRRLTMILERNTTRRMNWPLRAALVAMGLVVLPVSLHTLWAEPAAETEVPAATEEPAEPADPAGPAKPAESPSGDSEIEQRLDRLETLVRKLVESREPAAQSARPARRPVPGNGAETKSKRSQEAKSVFDTKRLVALQKESATSLGDIQRDTTRKFEVAKTTARRTYEAHGQWKRARKGYDQGTVASGQVLDALRRRAEAQAHYARSVCELGDDPATYELALALLVNAEQARRDLKWLWGEMADRGAPRKDIEQVAKEYMIHQAAAENWGHMFHKAQAHKVTRNEYRGAGQKFRIEQPVRPEGDASQSDAVAQSQNLTARKALAEAYVARNEAARVAKMRQAEINNLEKAANAVRAQFDEMQRRQAEEIRKLEDGQRKQVAEAERQLAEVRARKEVLDEALQAKREALARDIDARTNDFDLQRKKAVELLQKREAEVTKALEKARQEAIKAQQQKPGNADEGNKQEPAEPKTSDGAQRTNALPFLQELSAANNALADARTAWKVAYEQYRAVGSSAEAAKEAQARELYFQAKLQVQAALNSYSENRRK